MAIHVAAPIEEDVPEIAALIATLITDRPLCMTCITDKSGVTADEIDEYLRRIHRAMAVHRAIDRCRACGRLTDLLAFFRSS
jgi:hypothetical protein